jgi:Na+/melibiose symporter-like transporter
VTLWLFLHYFGFVLWLGAGVASMLAGLGARREGAAVIAAVTRIQAALQRNVIAPGAGLVIVTGLFLTMKTFGMGNVAPSGWLMTMQVAGLLGAGLTLFVALPTSSRLARISPEGATAPLFEQLRKRMAIAGSLAGSLGWLALIAGAALRGG